MERKKDIKVQSVQRALEILEVLHNSRNPLSAIEISEITGLNRSTVHSLIDTLLCLHYITKDKLSSKYQPSIKMYALSIGYSDRLPVVRFCLPLLTPFAQRYNVALHLGMLTEDDLLFLVKKHAPDSYNSRRSGYILPLHASSLGKVHLAFLPPDKVEKLLANIDFSPYTQNTMTDRETLMREVDEVKKCGFAMDYSEFVYGVSCVGFPIFDSDNNLAGTFSLSGKSEIMASTFDKIIPDGLQVSRHCSQELGCQNPPFFSYTPSNS